MYRKFALYCHIGRQILVVPQRGSLQVGLNGPRGAPASYDMKERTVATMALAIPK